MNSVPTLKSSAIAKFKPEQLKDIIMIMEAKNCKFNTIIRNDLKKYDTSLDFIINFNMDYDGWWGCPHTVAAFTINPNLMED